MVEGAEPRYIIISELDLFADGSSEAEKLGQIVERGRVDAGYPNTFITETRTQTDWGASGGGQEIVIQLMTDPGVKAVAENLAWKATQGAALGAGSLMAQSVLKKLKQLRRKDRDESNDETEEPQENADQVQHADLDWSIMRAKGSVASAYKLEWDDLDVANANRVEDVSQVVLEHLPSTRRFRTIVDQDGYSMSIEPLSSSS
ncbi:MAG: hypothetical protein ACR2KW_04920 [Rubrobacter sp.]